MKGVSIDEALCAYPKKYHKGQENAASSKELEAAFHVGGTELRRAVNRLRSGHAHIAVEYICCLLGRFPFEMGQGRHLIPRLVPLYGDQLTR